MRLLFVAAEMAPLVKVGGLGDVLGALPHALAARGHDVRVLLPAYSPAMVRNALPLATLPGGRLLELRDPPPGLTVWLLETPGFVQREGRPYAREDGAPWPDDAKQFGLLARVAADIAAGRVGDGWIPDVVHCHDWHTGLAPVWMRLEATAAASVFTVHNLEYAGRFAPNVLTELGLPEALYHHDALEFHGDVAFMKGGLCFADELTTVSPRYAQEILRPEFGAGFHGVLAQRRDHLTGILNGLDTEVWNPAADEHLQQPFHAGDLRGKATARRRLVTEVGLEPLGRGEPVLAWIGRLTAQKGVDLLIEALPELLRRPLRMVVLGSGDPEIEQALTELADARPGKLAVRTGFDEGFAHRLYAGADLLLMPSRFEPCGLAQLCAMRYGTVPVATAVGGLVDTVVDLDAGGESGHHAGTGFLMATPHPEEMVAAVDRARAYFDDRRHWRTLVRRVMGQSWDWGGRAAEYERVYARALETRSGTAAFARISAGRAVPPPAPP